MTQVGRIGLLYKLDKDRLAALEATKEEGPQEKRPQDAALRGASRGDGAAEGRGAGQRAAPSGA